jgi:hypothetical protein
MCLFAARQARTTLNEARSATLQTGGWEAATASVFGSGRGSLDVLDLPGVKINDS